MRVLLVVTALAISTSAAAQRGRTLVFSVEHDEHELVAEVVLQMAAWDVTFQPPPEGERLEERVAGARRTLESYDAVAWFESPELARLEGDVGGLDDFRVVRCHAARVPPH